MSLSVFYAVRFSPAPELGEWLNVAVVGEGISEHQAGIIVAESAARIEAAFGAEAVERVKAICDDLTSQVAEMVRAHERGEETKPIPTAMRDHALSLSFSDQIVVFEGTFEEALGAIAKKYLASKDAAESEAQSSAQTAGAGQENDLARITEMFQSRLSQFSRAIFPEGASKVIAQGQKAIENIVHGSDAATVLVVGGGGHLGSALLPKLTSSQNHQLATSMQGVDVVVFIPDSDARSCSERISAAIACANSAKAGGVERFVFADTYRLSDEVIAHLEEELHGLGDDRFVVTILRLGELYGHGESTQWFGDLHDEDGQLHDHPAVNVLTVKAILHGEVSAIETGPRPFLHVEDAAVMSIMAVGWTDPPKWSTGRFIMWAQERSGSNCG